MSAIFLVNLDRIDPVIDGKRHIIRQAPDCPQSGDHVSTLCGLTEPVRFEQKQGRLHKIPRCKECRRADIELSARSSTGLGTPISRVDTP